MSNNSDKSTATDVLGSLRSRTRAVHQRLHQHPITRYLIRKNLTLDQYVTALYAFDRYHEMIESEQNKFPEFNSRPRASILIKRDYLKLTDNPSNPFPPCPPLNLENSPNAGLGLMYVVEGARQGGNMIARNINNILALDANCGAAFFSQVSIKQETDWNSFISLLNQRCTDLQICCDAAICAFEGLESYLRTAQEALPISIDLTEPA